LIARGTFRPDALLEAAEGTGDGVAVVSSGADVAMMKAVEGPCDTEAVVDSEANVDILGLKGPHPHFWKA
jgi:hypothetical protein